MKDYQIEKEIIQSFIRKNKQERLLYELTKPDKRSKGLDRFAHQAQDLLYPDKISLKGCDLTKQDEFRRFLEQHEENCHIISNDPKLDRQYLPLSEAIIQADYSFEAVLIKGKDFLLVFSEAEKGGRMKYLLCR